MVGFEELLGRFRARLRQKIRNGEITERGLARLSGVSQSHVHNALKGARLLRPRTADRVMRAMRISVCDLMAPDDWEDSGAEGRDQRRPASR